MIGVRIPVTNNRVIREGCEQDQYYQELVPELWDWLDNLTPDWEMSCGAYDYWEFFFPLENQAVMFKLTWGGC